MAEKKNLHSERKPLILNVPPVFFVRCPGLCDNIAWDAHKLCIRVF